MKNLNIKIHGNKGKKLSEEHKMKISKANKGKLLGVNRKPFSRQWRQNISNGSKGKKLSTECKSKMSKSHKGQKWSDDRKSKMSKARKGKKWSDARKADFSKARKGNISASCKLKLRLYSIKRIERTKLAGLPLTPCIGRNETKILDRFEKDLNIKITRQFKVQGYFLDGYDEANNVAYEVDEARHFVEGQLCTKDIERQNNITEHLNCSFIRIRDLNEGEILQ